MQEISLFSYKKLQAMNTPKYFSIDLPLPPYYLELGSGVGYHAIQFSLQKTSANYMAIERNKTRFTKFLRRIESHKKKGKLGESIIPIRADARIWVPYFIPLNSVEKCFILYPNPFPRKNRWHRNNAFFSYLVSTLRSGGEIILATNIKEYAEESKYYCEEKHSLTCLEYKKIRKGIKACSHFEKKYLERGEDCWHLHFSKI